MSHRALLVASAFAAILASPAYAAPPESQFSWANVKVIKASDLLNSGFVAANYGETFWFSIRDTVQAHDFVTGGFRIRFFRADAAWNPLPFRNDQPIPYLQFPPCDIYLSGVWKNLSASDTLVQVGPVQGLGWLSIGATKTLEDGRWLMVFEKNDAPGADNILRLKNTDRAAYFGLAARLVVKANGQYLVSALPVLTEQNIKDINTMKTEAAANTPSRRCMTLKTFADAAPKVLAELSACATDTAQPG